MKDSRLPKDVDQTEQTRVVVKQTRNKTEQTRTNKAARVCVFVLS